MRKDDAIAKLRGQIEQIRSVKATARFGATFQKWHRDTRVVLAKVFPDEPGHVKEFAGIRFKLMAYSSGTPDSSFQAAYIRGLEHAEVFLESCIREIDEYWETDSNRISGANLEPYVDLKRLDEIGPIRSTSYDLSKLTTLCREMNIAHANGATYSVIMLLRSILDHVPPIFDCQTFSQVASQIGGKSKKVLLSRLEETSRELANVHLHQHIRRKEPALTATQVNFRSELDLLLAEVVHALHNTEDRKPNTYKAQLSQETNESNRK